MRDIDQLHWRGVWGRCFRWVLLLAALVGVMAAGLPQAQAAAPGQTGQVRTVVPLGQAVGIKLFANGVLVVDVSALEGVGGKSPAQKCGNHKSGLRLRNGQIQLAIAGTSPPLVANIGKYFGRVIDQR